jgi:adenylate cyclase
MASAKPSLTALRFSWRAFLFGIVLLGLMFVAHDRFHGAFERMDLIAYDLRINTITPRPSSGMVAIATIDDRSIAQLGQWPWPRLVLARLVDALKEYKVTVIGFDAIFSEADNGDVTRGEIGEKLAGLGLKHDAIGEVLGPGNDQAFAVAMKSQGLTVLGYPFQSHNSKAPSGSVTTAGYLDKIRPPAPLAYSIVRQAPGKPHDLIQANAYLPPYVVLGDGAHSTGYVDVDADADGEIRSVMTVVRFDGRYCAPLFIAVADAYAGGAPMVLGIDPDGVSAVSIAGERIPVDDNGLMLVNFRRGANPFPRYSVSDIINRRIAPEKLTGKIVLVGATAHGLGDRGVTPVDPDMPRVEIHANAIDNMIQSDFIRRPIEAQEIALGAAIVIGVLMSLGVAWLSAPMSAALGAILLVGYYVYAQARLLNDGLVIGVVFPLLTAIVIYTFLAGYRYITEGREKHHLRVAFGHYLHPDVISAVVDQRDGLKLGGERRHMSILFADIVNYTGLSERTDPVALVALLNDYMTKMTDHIMESGGVVDKIRGDGIMAFWGAPLAVANHARAAIDSGLAMLMKLEALRKHDPRFAEIDIGVGIATGEAIVGNFGGERRFDYSVIGDTVNLASRLEGLTRQFKVHLLVSRVTYTEAGAGFIGRELGMVKVKGKELLVSIVDVAGRDNDSVDPAFYRRFGDALSKIRAGDVFSARQDLERLGEERPNDAPVRMYLDRLAADPEHPPADMVFEFESK